MAAKLFNVSTILTAMETESFSESIWPQLHDVFDDQPTIERTSMNSCDDQGFRAAIKVTGKKNIIILTRLWSELCVTWPMLELINSFYENLLRYVDS